MVHPKVRRNLFPSHTTAISVLLIALVGCVFVIYRQLNVPFNNNYTFFQNPSIIRLGVIEKLDLNYVEDNLNSLDQKDPQLIQYTRVRHLTPPSKHPYNFGSVKNKNQRYEFNEVIFQLFGKKRSGVFIEAGANDGSAVSSHTLSLETELGWSGLLVECNPTVIPYLRTKHRKAWIADVCLSPAGHAETLNFSTPITWSYSGTLGKPWELPKPISSNWTTFEVLAVPFYTILAGLGWKEVDLFCFDVEGQELAILRNFPFDLFRFKVLIYEEQFTSEEERSELDDLLKKNGYVFFKALPNDKVYIHVEFYKELMAAKKL